MFIYINDNKNKSADSWTKQRRYSAHKLGGREIVTLTTTAQDNSRFGEAVGALAQSTVGRPLNKTDFAYVELPGSDVAKFLRSQGVNVVAAKGDDNFEPVLELTEAGNE